MIWFSTMSLTWSGYPLWNIRTHSKDFQIHLFLHFSHDMSYISPFFLMSNEIILYQILCRLLKYLLFSLTKVRIIKFIQCRPYFINGPKFLKILLFETFYIVIGHLVLVTFMHLYTLTHKVFVVKILGQKNLFRYSLWVLEPFFPHATKFWIFFKNLVGILKLVQIWHSMHRIIPL